MHCANKFTHSIVYCCYVCEQCERKFLMAYYKTAVSPLLMHWRYCSLALSHHFVFVALQISRPGLVFYKGKS